MKVTRALRTAVPFAISLGILAYLLSSLEIGPALERANSDSLLSLGAALILFGGFTLWVEGRSLLRAVPDEAVGHLTLWTVMRIKCASYLLTVVNIALGVGALSYLLHRRSRLGLSDAAGVAILLSVFDLSLLVLVGIVGATALATDAFALHASALLAAAAALAGGFVLLRAPFDLGPLERLRRLELFRAARTTPPARLIELAGLRTLMVTAFMAVFWAALRSFDIEIPLGPLLVGIITVTVVSSLPIAVSGLGTGQAAFIFCFREYADEATLLACSLALSLGLILLRGTMGLVFAGEFTREAIQAARSAET